MGIAEACLLSSELALLALLIDAPTTLPMMPPRSASPTFVVEPGLPIIYLTTLAERVCFADDPGGPLVDDAEPFVTILA